MRKNAVPSALIVALLLVGGCNNRPKEKPATAAPAQETTAPPVPSAPSPPAATASDAAAAATTAPAPVGAAAPPDVAAPPADATRTPRGLAGKVLAPGTGKDHPAPRTR